ncbi:Cg10p [Cyanidiococcus yangmingshanensis]|uniref:Cg10p n=1 Tax=Cyanidiococcus yangmingshanensis TaxID=2690220 RepID=A0A7J7IED2_9RHOD|nr:Cg10p [Cyanidiococcus yangmingshanensis]
MTGGNRSHKTTAERLDRWLPRSVLGVYACALLFSAVCNAVFFKRMTNAMPNYPYFLSQVTTWIYLPVLGIVLVFMRVFEQPGRTAGAPLPQFKLALVGLLEAFAGICTVLGGVYTRGTTQMILVQASIPMTMLWSGLILGARYVAHQFFAAGIIILGALVVLAPRILGVTPAAEENAGTIDLLFFNLVFLTAQVPQSLAHVYKEYALRRHELNVFVTMFYIAWYQSLIGMCLIPVNCMPMFGAARVALPQVPDLLLNGCKCLLGKDIIHSGCEQGPGIGRPPLPLCDRCAGAWRPVAMYMVANILYNIFGILVIKHSGATLYAMLMTLRLPLVSFAFCMPFFMGDEAQPMDWFDFVGLFVILIGLFVYRWEERLGRQLAGDVSMSTSQDADREQAASANVAVGPIVSEPLLLDIPASGPLSGPAARGWTSQPWRRLINWAHVFRSRGSYGTFG